MKTRSFAAVFLLPLVLARVPLATAQPTAAPDAPTADSKIRIADVPEVRDAFVKVDIWLEGQRIRYDLPGFSVGVVHDQELIWSKGYGFADLANKVPATDETLYRIASITKTFTATAVMQLVEQGRLSLDDPVVQHLPWFTPKDADPTHPIRVWHLLTHTAGLVRDPPGGNWDTLVFPSRADLMSSTPETPPSFPPQTRLKYSNYGYIVAGELITQLAGSPYTRQVEARILQPLGMASTRFLDGTETCVGLALPYSRRLGNRERSVLDQKKQKETPAAGGLVSNVRDLAKWASFHLNESDTYKGPVLTGRSSQEMRQPRFLLPDWSLGRSIGWSLTPGAKGAVLTHSGGTPGYMTRLVVDPARKLGVIVLINADDGPEQPLSAGMLRILSEPDRARWSFRGGGDGCFRRSRALRGTLSRPIRCVRSRRRVGWKAPRDRPRDRPHRKRDNDPDPGRSDDLQGQGWLHQLLDECRVADRVHPRRFRAGDGVHRRGRRPPLPPR